MEKMTNTAGAEDVHKLVNQTQLLNILECPICTEIPLPPIYSCINGHSICTSCRERMENCGLCKGSFTNVRSITLESIVNDSEFKCKFLEDGCKEAIKGENFMHHLGECDFRPVQCYQRSGRKCKGDLIPYGSYLQHIQNDHKKLGMNNDSHNSFIYAQNCNTFEQETSWPLYPKLYAGEIFYVNSVLQNDAVYWWLSMQGGDKHAKAFQVIITLENPEDPQVFKVEWTMNVFSFRKEFSEVKSCVACIPTENLIPICAKEFCSNHGDIYKFKWDVKFTISEST